MIRRKPILVEITRNMDWAIKRRNATSMFLTAELCNSQRSGISTMGTYKQLLDRLGVDLRLREQSLLVVPALVVLR